jgi:hypothetical protein
MPPATCRKATVLLGATVRDDVASIERLLDMLMLLVASVSLVVIERGRAIDRATRVVDACADTLEVAITRLNAPPPGIA